jgi:hypothetical protein
LRRFLLGAKRDCVAKDSGGEPPENQRPVSRHNDLRAEQQEVTDEPGRKTAGSVARNCHFRLENGSRAQSYGPNPVADEVTGSTALSTTPCLIIVFPKAREVN